MGELCRDGKCKRRGRKRQVVNNAEGISGDLDRLKYPFFFFFRKSELANSADEDELST